MKLKSKIRIKSRSQGKFAIVDNDKDHNKIESQMGKTVNLMTVIK